MEGARHPARRPAGRRLQGRAGQRQLPYQTRTQAQSEGKTVAPLSQVHNPQEGPTSVWRGLSVNPSKKHYTWTVPAHAGVGWHFLNVSIKNYWILPRLLPRYQHFGTHPHSHVSSHKHTCGGRRSIRPHHPPKELRQSRRGRTRQSLGWTPQRTSSPWPMSPRTSARLSGFLEASSALFPRRQFNECYHHLIPSNNFGISGKKPSKGNFPSSLNVLQFCIKVFFSHVVLLTCWNSENYSLWFVNTPEGRYPPPSHRITEWPTRVTGTVQ